MKTIHQEEIVDTEPELTQKRQQKIGLYLSRLFIHVWYWLGILIFIYYGLYLIGEVFRLQVFLELTATTILIIASFIFAEKLGFWRNPNWTIYEWKGDESAAKRAAYSFGRIILVLFAVFTITISIRFLINSLLELFIGEYIFAFILAIISVPVIVSLIDYVLGLFPFIKK